LYVANEGAFVCIVDQSVANEALALLQTENPLASNIGTITEEHPNKVILHSAFGGKRVVNPLIGEQLPRIC
jgi:hydrogenase expression/formation protein HypE